MKQSWIDAWWLTKFEIKKIKFSLLLSVLVVVVYSFAYSTLFPNFKITDQMFSKVFFDLLFVAGVTTIPYLGRTKDYGLKRLYGDFWGTSYFNFLFQTPISKKALVKSRFLTYGLQSLVLNIILLVLFYILSQPFQESLTLGNFILFTIVWLTLGLQASAMLAASEVGSEMSMSKIIFYSILVYTIILGAAFWYYKATGLGIVEGTINLIVSYPVFTLVGSILLLIIGYFLWGRYSFKIITKNNYL
ncbi:hypothetical protein ACQKP0_00080 [Heyndrickxia sp. NPDC080065]|uniref:hypothetical protein n=1 Tax=Heyndrickxia sp. NPDC080065 TaxID=3390568 RepID=UPI003D00F56F